MSEINQPQTFLKVNFSAYCKANALTKRREDIARRIEPRRTCLRDDLQRRFLLQHGARMIFFTIFALQVFESASKTCNAKTRIFAQDVSCNLPVVNFVAINIGVVGNRPVLHHLNEQMQFFCEATLTFGFSCRGDFFLGVFQVASRAPKSFTTRDTSSHEHDLLDLRRGLRFFH